MRFGINEPDETYLPVSSKSSAAQRGDRHLAGAAPRAGSKLIEGFETPYGMELLATVHWASTEEPSCSSFEEVLQRVHDWNKRKRQIMAPAHIKLAHDRLVVEGWSKPLGGELNRPNRATN
jgi:hypothetical protein